MADEQDNPAELGGRFNEFEGGTLVFSPVTGVTPSFADLPLMPQVVVKIVDEIPVPIDQGQVLSLDEIGSLAGLPPEHPLLQAVRFIHGDVVARRLFDDLDNSALGGMVFSAQDLPSLVRFAHRGLLESVDMSTPSMSRETRGAEAPLLHRISIQPDGR